MKKNIHYVIITTILVVMVGFVLPSAESQLGGGGGQECWGCHSLNLPLPDGGFQQCTVCLTLEFDDATGCVSVFSCGCVEAFPGSCQYL